jgi:hypothetical protein
VDSQVVLGLAYAKGIGVPQNYVEAHKWYASLAKYADVRVDVIKRRDELALLMPPSQIAEAQKLAADWKAKANQ